MGLAIVAVPEQGDRTYKISSEKVPHCTILFLGEAEKANVPEIASYLEHALEFENVGPFGLEVERRGKLGDEDADVLFFHKRWSGKRLEELRDKLLKSRHIKDAFDSVEQFDGWTPHLTLGYPSAPARTDDRDYPIGYVQFDKIELWTGDYTGPSFELSYDYNDDLAEVAMSMQAERGREYLEHYGVKGMKWGQRKSRNEAARAEAFTNRGIRGNKTKIKTKGGQGQDAAKDAIDAALTKQKFKESGPAALSNRELRDLNQRLQLEQQTRQLVDQTSPGKSFVKKTLGGAGKQQVQTVVNQEASRAVGEAMKKRR